MAERCEALWGLGRGGAELFARGHWNRAGRSKECFPLAPPRTQLRLTRRLEGS